MNTPLRLTLAAALLASALATSGCLPLAATGAAVGTMAVLDRRTLGTQTEDQAIEMKVASRLRENTPQASSGVSVTSFNRKVLLTGQVASEDEKRLVERAVAGVENVQSIHNELQVQPRPSLRTTASDASITARVKTAFIDAKDLQTNAFKVVTEAGTVYLMGLVSRREGDRAAQVASRVAGVQRGGTGFQYIAEEDATRLSQQK